MAPIADGIGGHNRFMADIGIKGLNIDPLQVRDPG